MRRDSSWRWRRCSSMSGTACTACSFSDVQDRRYRANVASRTQSSYRSQTNSTLHFTRRWTLLRGRLRGGVLGRALQLCQPSEQRVAPLRSTAPQCPDQNHAVGDLTLIGKLQQDWLGLLEAQLPQREYTRPSLECVAARELVLDHQARRVLRDLRQQVEQSDELLSMRSRQTLSHQWQDRHPDARQRRTASAAHQRANGFSSSSSCRNSGIWRLDKSGNCRSSRAETLSFVPGGQRLGSSSFHQRRSNTKARISPQSGHRPVNLS